MIALATALAVAATPVSGLSHADTLRPFFAKLAHAGTRQVHILQIGDSHTAGDAITGAWRDILQQRYGSGGRGVLAPGRPYDGYITHGVTVTMSPGWKIASDFGSNWSQPSPPLGLSAFTLTSTTEGASMSLVADPNELFDRFSVCALMRPGGGRLTLHAGDQTVSFDLGSPTERPECRTMRLAQPTANADVTVSDGPVTLTSWATFREGRGVVLSNLGVVGSQLLHWARTDDAVLTEELANYRPDLIVLAFGTNEGFAPRVSDFEYEVTLRTQIGRIRRLAGNVPILLLGAPDALSRRPEMRANSNGGPSLDCGAPAPESSAAQPSVIETIMERLRNSLGMVSSEPALQPLRGGARASRDLQLFEDVLEVTAGGFGRDVERAADLFVGEAARQQTEHLELARREPAIGFGHSSAMPGRGQHVLCAPHYPIVAANRQQRGGFLTSGELPEPRRQVSC